MFCCLVLLVGFVTEWLSDWLYIQVLPCVTLWLCDCADVYQGRYMVVWLYNFVLL